MSLPRVMYDYGPPTIVAGAATYCLVRAIEVDTDATARRLLVVGMALVIAAVAILVRQIQVDTSRSVASELRKIRTAISDLSRDIEYRGAARGMLAVLDELNQSDDHAPPRWMPPGPRGTDEDARRRDDDSNG